MDPDIFELVHGDVFDNTIAEWMLELIAMRSNVKTSKILSTAHVH